jgi:polyphosphate kinase
VLYFYNAGQESLYLSSADWMPRNLNQRVELAFPIEDEKLKKRLFKEAFSLAIEDNVTAWQLLSDGTYVKNTSPDDEKRSSQALLIQRLSQGK